MKVYLMGDMGERFGSEWQMSATRLSDVFKLINCQRTGFIQYLEDCNEKGVNFTVRNGEEFIGEEEIELSLKEGDLIVTPIPQGAGGGAGKLLAGLAIIGIVIISGGIAGGVGGWAAASAELGGGLTTWGALALGIGLNLALSGIEEILAPGPEKDRQEDESYLFSGPENNYKEGQPVPILYGEMIIGGAPINVTFTTQPLLSTGYTYTSTETVNNYAVNQSFNPMFTPYGF